MVMICCDLHVRSMSATCEHLLRMGECHFSESQFLIFGYINFT